jgi:hypothetical protein
MKMLMVRTGIAVEMIMTNEDGGDGEGMMTTMIVIGFFC